MKFLYKILKYCLLLLFCVTLLLLTGWNIPQTRDKMLQAKERIEEHYDIDIDKSVTEFMKYYDWLKGNRRHY